MSDRDQTGEVDELDIDLDGDEEVEARETGADDVGADPDHGNDDGSEPPGHVDEIGAPPDEDVEPEEELEILRDRHLRLAAEFDNYRRRTRKEMLEAGEAARADLSKRLLEIIDDLTRVAEAPCDPEQHQAMHDGVGLIARKLLKTLGDVGMEPVNPEGERFDPNFHEAIILTPTDDPDLDEHVSQVMLTGYRLADRLLRAAQVAVYRYEEGE